MCSVSTLVNVGRSDLVVCNIHVERWVFLRIEVADLPETFNLSVHKPHKVEGWQSALRVPKDFDSTLSGC